MQREDGKFLFGLGAPKAGTSWMHGYLAAHPEVYVPPVKELHFFNAAEDGPGDRLKKLDAKYARTLKRGRVGYPTLDELSDIQALLADGTDTAYRHYMYDRAEGRQVMADITPAYGLLSKERLLDMQAIGESRFVYLMRDPVSRLWSNIRMNARRIVRRTGAELSLTCKKLLKKALLGKLPSLQARCDYRSVLENIAALTQKNVLIAFYEELFTNETVTRICDLIDVAVMPAKFDQRINEGHAVAMTESDRARAAHYLKPQYTAVQAHMGRLPDAWKQNAGVA